MIILTLAYMNQISKKTVLSKIIGKKHHLFSSPFLSLPSRLLVFQMHYDVATCNFFLQSYANHKNLSEGKKLHSVMITSGFMHLPSSITSLINMYSKCNHMEQAVLVFHDPYHESNVFAYNAIIAGFVANRLPAHGFQFYKRMRSVGVMPDKFTFPCVVRACCEFMEVRKIHGCLFKLGLELDMFVSSALVNTYLKFDLMEDAKKVFKELPERDVVLWNAMINGYAKIGHLNKAVVVFKKMGEEGISPCRFTITGILSIFSLMGDINNGRAIHGIVTKMGYSSCVAVSNALIDMYGKCKHIEDALVIFEMINEKDLFSWNSIISAHEQCVDHDGTLRFFDKMLASRVLPDVITITAVLPACSYFAALMHGREIHGYMTVNGLGKNEDGDDVLLNNAVMDMYAKCGCLKNAHRVFDRTSNKDVASWNIMIMGYAMHGYGQEALDMFHHMCEAQIKPDAITFVGVLSACSHAGFLRQGRSFLARMELEFGVVPTIEHYTCIIDMLGRAGHLGEAYELAERIPLQDNLVLWMALLGACRLHGNADLGKVVGEKIMRLEPKHCGSGSYVLMSSMYGVVGRYEEALQVRRTMKEQNVKKTPGCSWIELKDGLYVFSMGDRTHPELNALIHCLCGIGYLHDEVMHSS